MKIKTITCHNVYNHGAILQEYALLEYLKSENFQVESINYQPNYLADNYKLWKVVNPKWDVNFLTRFLYILLKFPQRVNNLKRYRSFNFFAKKYLNVTTLKYTNNATLKNNLPDADAYICGSDQIWNPLFPNGNDLAFYLDFVPIHKVKISYAASFAVDHLEEEIKSFVKENVSKIDHISVREISALKILENLDINNAIQVLDPVFLLDAKFWKKTFVKVQNDRFILIYDFDSNSLIKQSALKIAKELDCKVYAINKNISYADKVFWHDGPETFLSLLANAQVILTNSFHAVAFSLIFKKHFFVVNRNENINTRMRDLLIILDIEEQLITNISNVNITKTIDYKKIEKRIEYLIMRSKKFLNDSLKRK